MYAINIQNKRIKPFFKVKIDMMMDKTMQKLLVMGENSMGTGCFESSFNVAKLML